MRRLYYILFLGLWSGVLASCPYHRFSKDHTYCRKPDKDCNVLRSTPATEAEAKQIVRMHNEMRSKVASGKESIGNLPTAADMLEMQWDEELAEIARRWAALCSMNHDCYDCSKTRHGYVGQNMAHGGKNWTYIIKGWYREVNDFNLGLLDSFDHLDGHKSGHFSQVIWSRSWRVGCGQALIKYEKSTYHSSVCNYGRRGNYPRSPVYKRGEMCSKCPLNTCCGDNCKKPSYPGLCQVQEGKIPVYPPREGTKYSYRCNFTDMESCDLTMTKSKPWTTYDSLIGNYIGIVLKKGEESNITIGTIEQPYSPACLTIFFRKGSDVAGEESRNEAKYVIIRDGKEEYISEIEDIKNFLPKMMQTDIVGPFSLTVMFKALSGTVYMEIQEISSREGRCDPNIIVPEE